MLCPRKLCVILLLVAPVSIIGMQAVVTNAVEIENGIECVEWAPCGTKVIVADASDCLKVYAIEGGKYKPFKKIPTVKPATKIVSSRSQNAFAVAQYNGLIEIFDGTTFEASPILITLPGRNVQALSWIEGTKYLVAYTTDYEPLQQGKDYHYPNKTVLYVCDTTTGELVRKFDIAQHVVDCKVAPSGKFLTLVKNLNNWKEDAFSFETRHRAERYSLEIYELNGLTTRVVAQWEFDCSVAAHTWSPDSDKIAVLLSNGTICIYLAGRGLFKQWHSEDNKQTSCTIDWSSITGYLSVPTKKSSVVLYDVEQGDGPVETIPLSRFTGNESKYLLPFHVTSSPISSLLAIVGRNTLESLKDTKLFLELIEKKKNRKRIKMASEPGYPDKQPVRKWYY